MELNFIFSIAVLIFSVVFHEIAHGYAAYFLGDPTAKLSGRLSVNPIKHIDPLGSVIFPSIAFMLGGVIFGWAKPVPVNTYNLRHGKWGEAIVAFAGPVSNLLIATVFALFLRFDPSFMTSSAEYFASYIVLINISLAVFNLVPIPPLDGSRIIYAVLPWHLAEKVRRFEQQSFILVLIFVFFIWEFLSPVVPWLFKIMVGTSL